MKLLRLFVMLAGTAALALLVAPVANAAERTTFVVPLSAECPDAVANGVFDERLEQEGRNHPRQQGVVRVDRHLEAAFEAGSAERNTQISVPISAVACSRSATPGSVAIMPLPCSRPRQPRISRSLPADFRIQG